MSGCSGCLSNTLLSVCSTLYLILGVGIMAGAGAAMATVIGQIVTPIYSASLMGGGVAIFAIAVIGFCAACDKQQRVCLLHIFTFLTFIMAVLCIAIAAVLFQYESVLNLASRAGTSAEDAVTGGISHATSAIDTAGTEVIKTLATNTFTACDASITASGTPPAYTLACANGDFGFLANAINDGFATPGFFRVLNVTAGSIYFGCYNGTTFASWEADVALTQSSLLAALNTPKGLFCACSSTIIDTYVLPYLAWGKWVAIGVCLFFLVVFVACVHQIRQRGCCGGKSRERNKEKNKEKVFNDIQMTFPADSKKGTFKDRDGGYIARP